MSKSASSGPKPTPAQVNHGDQLNPSHDAYWQSRGNPGRPDSGPVPAAPQQAPKTPSKG